MSRAFFVDPEVVALPLFDDGQHWIKVKQQLTAGEARQLLQGAFSRMVQAGTQAEPSVAFDLNFEAAAFLKVMLYLVDWNIPDKAGKTVDISTPKAMRDALKAMRQDAFKEIERVIDAHALSVEGNAKGGVPTPTTTTS
jgi:hypothetical protein